ncbi:MAG: MGMT family protein [Natronospirillum sp.]|uniref:MGMT family protein n=1 Tax=Natronospirillum sp. TaxID=2812955 RepID=UPI0025FCD25A|nr:MGMT family protein [Natronospirillum sp.]MCH8551696.1 MGMT family protein [Natronospirillum sp.]
MAEPDWREHLYTLVAAIPPGTTTSYGALARQISGASARSVARALSQLPEGSRLPWHRVIRSDGRIADHPGRAEQTERLKAEGVFIRS